MNGSAKTLKRFFDVSYGIEHSFNNFHSFVFACKDSDPKEFGHKYIRESGFRAIEGYPIEKVMISENNILNYFDRNIWRDEVFYTLNDWGEIEQNRRYIYSEFEFPEEFKEYNFYKIDIMLYENENKEMIWDYDENRDVFICGRFLKRYNKIMICN